MVTGPDGLRLVGRARDLHTPPAGEAVAEAATVDAVLDAEHRLVSIEAGADLGSLVDLHVGAGFRRHARERHPELEGTLLGLLVDELPVAALISGYGRLYSGEIDGSAATLGTQADLCAGWRRDGTMMVAIGRTGAIPVPKGPEAPDLEAADPQAWHAMDPLPPGAMRRQRLLDVDAGTAPDFVAMFRDLHADDEGVVTVLHEYGISGRYDVTTDRLLEVFAVPTVLPWPECPEASASAGRLAGMAPSEVRSTVSQDFRGTSTCTHLNDLLRSLGDLPALTTLRA